MEALTYRTNGATPFTKTRIEIPSYRMTINSYIKEEMVRRNFGTGTGINIILHR
jgi:hypothetical protein